MELKVFESPGKEWDEFASRYTDLIFYQSVWSQVLKEGLGGQPLYFYLREGKEIVAGLPAVLLNFKIFKILYASIPYGNMIGEKDCFPVFLSCLEKEFVRRGIDQVRITDSPFWENRNPDPSFKPIENVCTLINLRDMDEERLWKSHSKYVRRDIRRAQKNGIEVYKVVSKSDLDCLYKFYLNTMERNRAPAKYSRQLVSTLYDFIETSKKGVLLMARMHHQPVAGVLLIHSNSSTHAFFGGSYGQFLKFYTNELLIHESLLQAIRCGHKVFDFMGSDKEDEKLIWFKNKWGGQSVRVSTRVKDYHLLRCWMWNTLRNFISTSIGSILTRAIRRESLKG
jgi:hypothetical protein